MTTEAEMMEAIGRLPQAQHIYQDDAVAWVREILKQKSGLSPKRHIERLAGISGSEIGAAVGTRSGMSTFDFFGASDKTIVQTKLLRVPPSVPNAAMSRGRVMESVARQMFHETYSPEPDAEAMTAITSFKGTDEMPWLIGTPDEIVKMGGRRILIDYKVPGDASLMTEVSFGYKAQLHQYGLVAAQCGFPIDDYYLCVLDYKNWKVNMLRASKSPELERIIIETGNDLWFNYVLAGRIPERDFTVTEKASIDPETEELARNISCLTAGNKRLAEAIKNRKKMLGEQLGPENGGKRIDTPIHNVTIATEFDEERVAEWAETAGLPEEAWKKDGDGFDMEKVMALATKAGIDLSTAKKQVLDPDRVMTLLTERGMDPSAFKSVTVRFNEKKKNADYSEDVVWQTVSKVIVSTPEEEPPAPEVDRPSFLKR